MKNNINIQNKVVDFKSHYNKTKISEMDISNIYLKRKFWNICTRWSKIGWLKMNKESYWRTSVGTYL